MATEREFETGSNEDRRRAWAEEIERRIRQIDSGEVKTVPWEEVRAKLYARLNEPLDSICS